MTGTPTTLTVDDPEVIAVLPTKMEHFTPLPITGHFYTEAMFRWTGYVPVIARNLVLTQRQIICNRNLDNIARNGLALAVRNAKRNEQKKASRQRAIEKVTAVNRGGWGEGTIPLPKTPRHGKLKWLRKKK